MTTSVVHTGQTGLQTDYAVPFDYLDSDHVKVSLDGVATTAFTFLNVSMIQMDSAPTGDLRIYRETPDDTRLVNWTDGSILLDDTLNTDSLQSLYVAEEISEAALVKETSGNWDAGNLQIKNLPTPVDNGDAASKLYVLDQITDGGMSEIGTQVTEATTANQESQGARDLAQKWAEEDEDVEVESGSYSAKHQAIKATASAVSSNADKILAQTARIAAEAAEATAVAGVSNIYATLSAGETGTSDGDYFMVTSSDNNEVYQLYLNESDTGTYIKSFPSTPFIEEVAGKDETLRREIDTSGYRIYTGSGTVYPIVTDANLNIVLGWDTAAQELVGQGLASTSGLVKNIDLQLGSYDQENYNGSGPVYPIMTDVNRKVLLGFDANSGSLVGPGLDTVAGSAGSASAKATPRSLDASLVPVTNTNNHMLFYGQSLSVGANAGSLISVSQPYSNVTFQGGPRAYTGAAYSWSPLKPLVEDEVSPAPDGGTNRKESPCSGAANYATTLAALDGIDPTSHVILASTAGRGGYRIDQLEDGTAWWDIFEDHVNEAFTINTDYACHAVCWLQGENDVVADTSYATYRSKLEALQASAEAHVKSVNSQTGPVFLLTYQLSYGILTTPAIADAQLDLAQNNSKTFLVTPTYHIEHQTDNVHLTAVGYKHISAYYGRAYKALVHDNVEPRWLNPLSATRRGTEIRVRFDVPYGPLVLDTTTLAVTTDNGFRVTDDDVTTTISNVEVSGDDILITLASEPSGVVKVRYARDYLGAGLSITGGASGNLRDSDPETIDISGTSYPLFNVCPTFELTTIELGE